MTLLPDPRAFVTVMAPVLRQAAAIARALEGRVVNRPKSGETRAAKAALTLADTATQEALLVPLFEHFPFLRIEAEEDTPTVGRFPRHGDAVVVIDPIDGTLHSYLGGRGPYAVMVGLALRGRFEAALVALPREGLFFDTVRSRGAHCSRAGGPARPARVSSGGRRVIVSHEIPERALLQLRERGYDVVPGSGGAIAVAPLVAGVRAGLRIASAPEGISHRGRIGALIASEAGALVCDPGGSPVPDALETKLSGLLVAATESDLEALLAASTLAARH